MSAPGEGQVMGTPRDAATIAARDRATQEPLLVVRDLQKYFPVTRGLLKKTVGYVRAVDGVSFEIAPGETLGLVGESGCGKTTVGRCLLRLIEPSGGQVLFQGQDVATLGSGALRHLRRDLQIIFQDPFSSLNPRLRIVDLVGEPLQVHGDASGDAVRTRVIDLLQKVGVSENWIYRYPHEFSGGQRQRIGIARALALNPKLIVCDEAVSALDVSVRAQVLNLLIRLRNELGLAYLFISHDLSVVRHVSHRIAVMYVGELVELGLTQAVFHTPAHPYTEALLSAVPVPNPHHRGRRLILTGDVPTPLNPPSGCRFHTRCPVVMERCVQEKPPLYVLPPGRQTRCFHAEGLSEDRNWPSALRERYQKAEAHNAAVRVTVGQAVSPPALPVTPQEPWTAARVPTVAPLPADPSSAAPSDAAPSIRAALRATPRAPTGRVGAIVAILAGLLLTSSGWWIVGGLLAGLSYGLALRPKIQRRRAFDLGLLSAFVFACVTHAVTLDVQRVKRAKRELQALSGEIAGYTRTTGTPEALGDLGWRLFFWFGDGRASDPWGQPYQYLVTETGFELYSLGPDGTPSSDDIKSH